MSILLARKALNYTLNNQWSDGSFDNNGSPEKPMGLIDNYHTGFVLRILYSIWTIKCNNLVYNALEKGYNFLLRIRFQDIQPQENTGSTSIHAQRVYYKKY